MLANKTVAGCLVSGMFCLLFAGSVLAIDETALIEPNANDGESPNVPLLSGGVGEDELNYIKSVERQYDLKLLFTETNGVFLSDLPVSIRDKEGHTIVNTVTKGPVLLVKLHPGNYTVMASNGGMNHQEKISVSGRGLRTYQFRFPGNDMRSLEN